MTFGDTRAHCTSHVIAYLLSVSNPCVLGMFDGDILLYKVTLKSDSEKFLLTTEDFYCYICVLKFLFCLFSSFPL